MHTTTRLPQLPAAARLRAVVVAAAALTAAACSEAAPGTQPTSGASLARAGEAPGTHRQYGTPVKVGEGRARSYVVLNGGVPSEFGVALDERALEGLPAPMNMPGGGGSSHEHPDMHEYLLPVPAQNPTQYKLVELDWNPQGHGEPYTAPHFDFHFYTISKAERDAIDPADPAYATKAANSPTAQYVPQFFFDVASALGLPAAATAVPRMGVHWLDARAPEIQGMVGNPQGYKPFTTTFIHGAWNGKFIFDEPMITRAYIQAKKGAADPAVQNEVIALPQAAANAPARYVPGAYRIQWDAQAKEYRIALTGLTWKQ